MVPDRSRSGSPRRPAWATTTATRTATVELVRAESRTLGLDRNELGALLVQAGLGSERDHALISLLALNGLRISEALGADVEAMDIERGHRTLAIVRKGGKHVNIRLAPRTARSLDLYLRERTTGPVFLGVNGQRIDRYIVGAFLAGASRSS